MYKNSHKNPPTLSGHISMFGLVFFVLKSVRQWSCKNLQFCEVRPRSHVRILIHRMGVGENAVTEKG